MVLSKASNGCQGKSAPGRSCSGTGKEAHVTLTLKISRSTSYNGKRPAFEQRFFSHRNRKCFAPHSVIHPFMCLNKWEHFCVTLKCTHIKPLAIVCQKYRHTIDLKPQQTSEFFLAYGCFYRKGGNVRVLFQKCMSLHFFGRNFLFLFFPPLSTVALMLHSSDLTLKDRKNKRVLCWLFAVEMKETLVYSQKDLIKKRSYNLYSTMFLCSSSGRKKVKPSQKCLHTLIQIFFT